MLTAVGDNAVTPRRQRQRRPGHQVVGRPTAHWEGRCGAVGTLKSMAQAAEVHVTVGPDGSLSVAAPQLENAGIHAGDQVVVARKHRRKLRSMLGAHDRGIDFDIEDQRGIRAEMATGLGEDLTR
jgi:hypothetical protein